MSAASMKIKMSEYELPFHIQEEIMKRLPVKSLIQFRSVSKAWKSLIDSSKFIAAHSLHRHTQQQHLLVSYEDPIDEENYVCYIDDDTFPQQRSILTLPPSIKQLSFPRVVGSSHGLLCFYRYHPNPRTGMAVIWNPSIRKCVVVPFPERQISINAAMPHASFVSFGVCPVTNDPKIVVITQCDVMVYTLSSGKWRSLQTNRPTEPLIDYFWKAVSTDVFIYWRAGFANHYVIISFDVTTESFEVIDLPDCLVRLDPPKWRIFKLKESLAIVQSGIYISTVWMLEYGVQRAFTKLFTIKTPHDFINGFTKTGTPIVKVTDGDPEDSDYDDEPSKLVVCQPNSEHNNVLEISPDDHFTVNSYMETLLLLGRSDCRSY